MDVLKYVNIPYWRDCHCVAKENISSQLNIVNVGCSERGEFSKQEIDLAHAKTMQGADLTLLIRGGGDPIQKFSCQIQETLL